MEKKEIRKDHSLDLPRPLLSFLFFFCGVSCVALCCVTESECSHCCVRLYPLHKDGRKDRPYHSFPLSLSPSLSLLSPAGYACGKRRGCACVGSGSRLAQSRLLRRLTHQRNRRRKRPKTRTRTVRVHPLFSLAKALG